MNSKGELNLVVYDQCGGEEGTISIKLVITIVDLTKLCMLKYDSIHDHILLCSFSVF